jgi:eukaryotic-like serine/threonine-protein kinase
MTTADRILNHYRLVAPLGRGSMGTVYRAVDMVNGEAVAVKIMAHELAEDAELAERFRREAMAASKVTHPGITRVFELGEVEQQLYMAMELLDGDDLKDLIARGETGDLRRRIDLMVQVAAAMALVHANGLVHRDLKPGNIHVTPDGRAKIMDFGLVRFGDSNMTATGMVMGSPAYMSPEQLSGARVDSRSDVFSLGAVFYELLCGQRAFPAKGITQIMMSILQTEPKPLKDLVPEAPPTLTHVVERCLRKDVALRYQTAGELHAALEIVQLAAPQA